MSVAYAATTAQNGLPLGLDNSPRRTDIRRKAVGFPIFMLHTNHLHHPKTRP